MKTKKTVRYYIQDMSENISSNMRLVLQKNNTYSGGTYFARSFIFLFAAKLYVKKHKTLCSNTRILKRYLYSKHNSESYDSWFVI